MKQVPLPKSVFAFLKNIKKHNNRVWFNTNKNIYIEQYESVVHFAYVLIAKMNRHDNIETLSGKKAVFRIYRDIRFSKDKSPYKSHFGIHLSRATKLLRGGYYLHIEPGKCFVGGGFWGPTPEDLKHIREQIAMDPKPLRKIISSKKFKTNFGKLEGEKLVFAPKGFEKNHPAVDLLRYKQFLVSIPISDSVITSSKGIDEVVKSFRAMRPFFDYMSEILTTSTNGEPLL
ncbi:MAG: DUF2461 domain-containing protein [Bacteroidetes bacterium]|nr:MAG: DUF2461 domain-containing protein [Bacteroidota bacterium]